MGWDGDGDGDGNGDGDGDGDGDGMKTHRLCVCVSVSYMRPHECNGVFNLMNDIVPVLCGDYNMFL